MWWRFFDSASDFIAFSDTARQVYGEQEANVYLLAVMLPTTTNDHLWVESDENPRLSWTRDALEKYIQNAEDHGIYEVSRLTRDVFVTQCFKN